MSKAARVGFLRSQWVPIQLAIPAGKTSDHNQEIQLKVLMLVLLLFPKTTTGRVANVRGCSGFTECMQISRSKFRNQNRKRLWQFCVVLKVRLSL